MRFLEYITEAETRSSTFFHEVGTAIFLKDPNAVIETGNDIAAYFASKDIMAIDSSLSEVDIKEQGSSDFLEWNEKQIQGVSSTLKDAKKLANALRKKIGNPTPAPILWTGPTNNMSKYGAADIVVETSRGTMPVSLKKGSAQLKNLTLKTLGDTLFDGIIPDNGSFSSLVFNPDNLTYWNELTGEWTDAIVNFSPKEIKPLISQYRNYNNWKMFQKAKISDELLNQLNEVYFVPNKKSLSNKSENKFLRKIFARIYEIESNKSQLGQQWNKVKEDSFKKIFTGFFEGKEDKLNKNLKKVFTQQMSSGEGDMWYAAKGGEEIFFVPNIKTFSKISNEFLQFEYKTRVSGSGFYITLIVKTHRQPVILMTIEIIVRWKKGQMVGPPDVASKFRKHIKLNKWEELFSPGALGIRLK